MGIVSELRYCQVRGNGGSVLTSCFCHLPFNGLAAEVASCQGAAVEVGPYVRILGADRRSLGRVPRIVSEARDDRRACAGTVGIDRFLGAIAQDIILVIRGELNSTAVRGFALGVDEVVLVVVAVRPGQSVADAASPVSACNRFIDPFAANSHNSHTPRER